MAYPKKRRGTLALAVVAAGTLTLSACGGGNGGGDGAGPEEGALSGDLAEVYDINEASVDDLQDGGQLTLPVTNMGPNFNGLTNAGNSQAVRVIVSAIDTAGAWRLDPEGEYVLNEDFVLSAEQEILEDGTQTMHYELNPEATWNDGTPIDFHTYEHTVNIRSGAEEGYDLVATTAYDQIESIEMGEDEWSFTITMEEPYQPWQSIFNTGSQGDGVLIHPEVDTPEEFNEGYVNDLRSEYRAGPFTVDTLDMAANVASLVPNEDWWGDEPVLDRLNFAQYESGATIPAFQNGEIDSVGIANRPRYEELTEWSDEGYDIRRGQRMATCGYLLNGDSGNLSDVAVREAIFRTLDREQISEIQFEGVNWEEDTPSGWVLMPFQDEYEDVYPVEDSDPEAAGDVLEDAGWTYESEGDEFRSQDGEELRVVFNTFGDDPVGEAQAQAAQTMAAEAGIHLDIDNQGSAQFGEVVGNREFGMVNMCYGKAGADPTSGTNQFYSSQEGNLTGLGDEELDERIEENFATEDDEERFAEAVAIEEEALSTYFHYLATSNGPEIFAFREGLANYGPALFETTDWSRVGWLEEAGHDGSDSGVDEDELEDTDPDEVDEEGVPLEETEDGSEDDDTDE